MEINQNLTKITLVDVESPKFSALQKELEDKVKEDVKQTEESVGHKDVDAKKMAAVITKINEQIQNVHRDLTFSVDEKSGKNVVTILDSKSREIIRQFPSEELLVLARHLNEQLDTDGKVKAINLFSSIA